MINYHEEVIFLLYIVVNNILNLLDINFKYLVIIYSHSRM